MSPSSEPEQLGVQTMCAILEGTDYRAMWEEAARVALVWRKRYEDLYEEVESFLLWDPRRRGYGAAVERLVAALNGETEDR